MIQLIKWKFISFIIVPAERVRAGDYETGSVRVCVRLSVCASVCDQNLQFATSLSFMSQFWFCLLYMIALHGSFETSTQNFSCDLWPWPLTYIVHFATKCYSFAISNPISIPFALCDGTRWGLQNFYTEFWPLTSLTFDLDFLPILYILLQNATSGGDIYYAPRNFYFSLFVFFWIWETT